MAEQTLNATIRTTKGKGAARKMRVQGQIPAVCYGRNVDAQKLCVAPSELKAVLAGPHNINTIFNLVIEGGSTHEVMLKAFARHPVARHLLHADFAVVDHERILTVDVPVELKGVAVGVKLGGELKQLRRSAKVRCLPKDIPVSLEYDVTPLTLKDRALASQIVPPAGVVVIVDNDYAFAQVDVPRVAIVEDVAAPAEGVAEPAAVV